MKNQERKAAFRSLWIDYDKGNIETYPEKAGRYLVQRSDGKIHFENWNNTGWAYNNKVIVCYMPVHPRIKKYD